MAQWEIQYVQVSTNRMDMFMDAANRLGALGWEPVGITSADKTIGLNSNVVIFKRPISNPPAPSTSEVEWQPDPTGRHERRRWTWRGWGAECVNGRDGVVDPPDMHPDTPPGPR